MLVLGIERRRKKTAGLPFNGDRRLRFVVPKLRRSSALENQNLFLIHVANRFETFAGRYFDRESADEPLRAFQVTIAGRSAEPFPVRQLHGSQVFNAEA